MKKTLLALVLATIGTSAFAYVNLVSSGDGRSYLRGGLSAELSQRLTGSSYINLNNTNATERDNYHQQRYRFRATLDARAAITPAFYIGFFIRATHSFNPSTIVTTNKNYSANYLSASNRNNGNILRAYGVGFNDSRKLNYCYKSENGNQKCKTHSEYRPGFDRIQFWVNSYQYGKVTFAFKAQGSSNQNIGAADNNDFSTSTNFLDTPYSALSDVYLTGYDFSVRYDLTTDPRKPYKLAVSTARKKTDTYSYDSQWKYKYDNDYQVSASYEFSRNNKITLNAARKSSALTRGLKANSDRTSVKTTGYGIYADVRMPGRDNLRIRAEISTFTQNHRSWNYKNKELSYGIDLIHYDLFTRGFAVYGGYIYKSQTKDYYDNSRVLDAHTKQRVTYLGTQYNILDTYHGDKLTVKVYLEGSLDEIKYVNAPRNFGYNGKVYRKNASTGVAIYY
ncbi:hypothetical protein [Psittacicella hinzii]|uniref:DUF3570 domain-containing protein n=1 Tax=Psittacicella hinzii TaxID=2028575 RepID=A0A3A1YQD5_9GAMM|nr:hypothetical protein [Psittacicella hinzii]RIY39855.1 hypothetical protein CKF58_01430 [Psittacicella hinzii]